MKNLSNVNLILIQNKMKKDLHYMHNRSRTNDERIKSFDSKQNDGSKSLKTSEIINQKLAEYMTDENRSDKNQTKISDKFETDKQHIISQMK